MASSKEKLPYSMINGKNETDMGRFWPWHTTGHVFKSLQVCVTPWTGPGKQGSGS